MKSFYEMLALMERETSGFSSVERFSQDFEQVLNLIAGGPWNFMPGKFSPFESMDKDNSTEVWVFYIRTEYRGMSESGRHYKVGVRLNSVPSEPINRNGLALMKRWKQEFISYDPKGSAYDERARLPSVYFEVEEIYELGSDTNGRERIAPTELENPTPQQDAMQSMMVKLQKLQDDMEKDRPSPKWTPERRVYLRKSQDASPKNIRPVDLAKQVRDEIATYEKRHPSFKSR